MDNLGEQGSSSFDPLWESRYRDNAEYRNKYPWSSVVGFVFTNRPKDGASGDTNILEVGCGNGSNLWFAAREGFQVAGIDGSATAIEYARRWFEREGLAGDLRVGDYTELPFEDESFQLVIDRLALSYSGRAAVERAFAEISRVLVSGGRFMFTPYSDRCSSFDGLPDAQGYYQEVSGGTVAPTTRVRYYGLNEVREMFRTGWRILTLEHNERTYFEEPQRNVYAEWIVIAEKV